MICPCRMLRAMTAAVMKKNVGPVHVFLAFARLGRTAIRFQRREAMNRLPAVRVHMAV